MQTSDTLDPAVSISANSVTYLPAIYDYLTQTDFVQRPPAHGDVVEHPTRS